MDLDSTVALLSSNLPVGGDPNSAKKKKASDKKAAKKVEIEKPTSPQGSRVSGRNSLTR